MFWTKDATGNIFYWFIIFLKFIRLPYLFDNKIYHQDDCIKSHIWSDVIFFVSITLFCGQGCKSESLEET